MKITSAFTLFLLLASSISAGDWAQLRGPNFNGSTDEKNLPTTWSQTENIEWSVDMPGPSAATPVVSGDHVFVSSTDRANETVLAMCFDRTSGKLRWSHVVGKGIRKDTRSTFSTPMSTFAVCSAWESDPTSRLYLAGGSFSCSKNTRSKLYE